MVNESFPEQSPRTPSQSQRVVDGLLERIQRRQLVPGARIPTEPELMKEFNVSRSVVREAVSRLQANGVVRTRQGVGSFVLSPRPTVDLSMGDAPEELKVRQKLAMLELRLSLEADAAALAAQRRSIEQLAAMEAALAAFERRQEAGESTTEADFQFHELIAEATGNEYFVLVLRNLGKATILRTLSRGRPAKARRFGEVTPALKANKDVTLQEHREVLNAIRSSDPTHARAAMYLHLCKSIARLKAASG